MEEVQNIEELLASQLEVCKKLGISMQQLAEHAGVSRTTLWRWQNQERVPQWATMKVVIETADRLIQNRLADGQEIERKLLKRIGENAGVQ